MREIKFRAWNEEIKRMFYWEIKDAVSFNNGWKNIIIMQYAGLKDCKGKEIYEGDIVKLLPYHIKGIITYDQGVLAVRERGFTHYLNEYNIEIVGNIYENPKLIKEI